MWDQYEQWNVTCLLPRIWIDLRLQDIHIFLILRQIFVSSLAHFICKRSIIEINRALWVNGGNKMWRYKVFGSCRRFRVYRTMEMYLLSSVRENIFGCQNKWKGIYVEILDEYYTWIVFSGLAGILINEYTDLATIGLVREINWARKQLPNWASLWFTSTNRT